MVGYTKCSCLLACLAIALCGCADHELEPSGKVVRVGVIGPLSGPDETVGLSGLQGVELALGLQTHLDNGDRIELVKRDDRGDPELCAAAYDEMDDLDIAAILVLSRSNSALELSRRARTHRIPIVATVASHPDLTTKNAHLIQLSFDDEFQGAVAAMYARDELLLRRAAVVMDPADKHGDALARAFSEKFSEAAGRIVGQVEPGDATTSVTSVLASWQAARAQIIYAPLPAGQLLELLRGLQALKWAPVVMAADGALSEMVLQYGDELALVEGVLATDTYGNEPLRTDFGASLRSAYDSAAEQHGSTFTILGGEGMALLTAALNACEGDFDHRTVQAQLRSIRNFEGYAGAISVTEEGRVIRPVFVNTIINGRPDCLVRVY